MHAPIFDRRRILSRIMEMSTRISMDVTRVSHPVGGFPIEIETRISMLIKRVVRDCAFRNDFRQYGFVRYEPPMSRQ